MSSPAYFAVIPGAVLVDDKLPAGAKLLYGVITALSRATEDCWAGNEYFASIFRTHPKTIQAHLRALEDAGYISIQQDAKPQPGQRSQRHIHLNVSFTDGQTRNENFQTRNEKIPGQEIFAPPTSNINKNIYIGDDGPVNKYGMTSCMWKKLHEWARDIDNPSDLLDCISEFVSYRKQRKKPMTEIAFARFLNQLQKVSGGDAAVMRDCINTAILHGWDTVYPPREVAQRRAAVKNQGTFSDEGLVEI